MSNLNRNLKDLRGETMKMSFPRNEVEKLKSETVGNVILNALTTYPVKDRREVFQINRLASIAIESPDAITFSDDDKDILSSVLHEATYRKAGDKEMGVYLSWMIAQVLEEVGITK